MKLSIITINYNNKAGLEKTASSVLSQTWHDFEWILIDGGSSDGSKELIETLAKKPDANISYWVSEPDRGIYNAMNKGIAKAKGEYLEFLNSGDCFHGKDSLTKVFYQTLTDDVIYGNINFVGGEKDKLIMYPGKLTLEFLLESSIAHASSFIRKECFKDFRYPENYRIVSDWIAWLVFFLKGYSFCHTDIAVCDFTLGGISDTQPELLEEERRKAFDEFLPCGVLELSEENRRLRLDFDKYGKYFRKVKTIKDKGKCHRHLMNFFLSILEKI